MLTGRAVTWGSSDQTIATVNANGLVTGVALGSATITATSEGKSGTSSITVTKIPVGSVTVAPPSKALLVTQTVSLTATVRDSVGTVVTDRPRLVGLEQHPRGHGVVDRVGHRGRAGHRDDHGDERNQEWHEHDHGLARSSEHGRGSAGAGHARRQRHGATDSHHVGLDRRRADRARRDVGLERRDDGKRLGEWPGDRAQTGRRDDHGDQ